MAEKVKMEAKTCSKVTKNPFFNFLRCYRAQAMNQHRTAVETAVQGAKIWQKLSAKQREPFEKLAEPLLKPGVKRRPRASATRRRRASRGRAGRSRTRAARASRSRSRTRRAAAGRKRSATRRRRSTARRRSAAPKGRKPAARSSRRSRSRSVARKRVSASRRRAGSAARRTTAVGRQRTGRKRSRSRRSRSRTRGAPAKRARRATKARSASRKRGRPAGTRARRAQPVKLEAFTSPAGCDVCPKPAVADDAHSAAPAASSGAVLVSASIDEACNASVGSGTLHQASYDESGSPPAFQISAAQQLVCGPELSQSSRSRRTAERKAARNRSVLSEDEIAAADTQKSAKRARV